ncbi:MAG: MarC family protein [Chloroflexi bacterium]|nr:MarC family protein [Chloroflexota bacterium]
MAKILQDFLLTFIPLLIVIDALGNLPFVISITEGMGKPERRRMVNIAVVTATIVGLVFLLFGQLILRVLDISVGAFAIAGGIVLLVLSIKYMQTGHSVDATKEEMVAVVPIGTPLVVGPATITTLLLLASQFPMWLVLISFILNMLLTWVTFLFSDVFLRVLGAGGLRASSKVFSLLLAAIAVSMILRGFDLVGIFNING